MLSWKLIKDSIECCQNKHFHNWGKVNATLSMWIITNVNFQVLNKYIINFEGQWIRGLQEE